MTGIVEGIIINSEKWGYPWNLKKNNEIWNFSLNWQTMSKKNLNYLLNNSKQVTQNRNNFNLIRTFQFPNLKYFNFL